MHANCDCTWELYRHHKTKRAGTGSWLGKKNPCHTRDSSLSVLAICACLFSQTLSQLSYSHPFATVAALFCVHCSVCVPYATATGQRTAWTNVPPQQTLRMTSDILLQHHSACNLCHFVTVCQCHFLTGQHTWAANIIIYTCWHRSCPCEALRAHLEMKC